MQEQLVIVFHHAEMVTPLLVEYDVVEADAVALGIHVELPHCVGLVAGVPERLRQSRDLRHPELLAEEVVAVAACLGACHDLSPSWDAGRSRRVGVGVGDAVSDELV